MSYSAILFDFNGLIIDDESIHYECFKRVLANEEIELTEKDYWEIYLGFDDKGLIDAVFQRDQKKLTPKKIKNLILEKNVLYFPIVENNLKFFPGVLEFIGRVKKQYPLAIVSGALRSEIDYVLQKGEVLDAFSVIVSADDTKHGKPDPEGFLIVLAKLKKQNPNVRAETCLVLEDSHAGIEAAHRARMKVIALPHTYPKQALKDADFVMDSFEAIGKFLK